MPETHSPADATAATREFGTAILSAASFPPPVDQFQSVRDYLAEIDAAIRLLPALMAEDIGLDADYDPAWPEETP